MLPESDTLSHRDGSHIEAEGPRRSDGLAGDADATEQLADAGDDGVDVGCLDIAGVDARRALFLVDLWCVLKLEKDLGLDSFRGDLGGVDLAVPVADGVEFARCDVFESGDRCAIVESLLGGERGMYHPG